MLGAGNCNDIDLYEILTAFAKVHLVDLDSEALAAGSAFQQVDDSSRLVLHGGVDLMGMAHRLDACSPDIFAAREIVDRCLEDARTVALPVSSSRFSVVASVCLLSQLVEAIVLTLGEIHPRFLEMVDFVRRQHIELLTDLTAAHGTCLLITDVVSSETCPALAYVEASQLPSVVAQAIQNRNFFTGMNPFVLRALLETDAEISAGLKEVRLSNPWRWNLGPRIYAVCALTATKR